MPGLHQLKTPMPTPALPYVMAYVFEGSDGISLFDSGHGTPAATEALRDGLRAIGHEPAEIQRVMVSHAHPDHLGMVGWIQRQSPDCEVVMLEQEWAAFGERGPFGRGAGRGAAGGPEAWMRRSDGWLVRHGVSRDEVDQARRSGGDRPPWAAGASGGGARRMAVRALTAVGLDAPARRLRDAMGGGGRRGFGPMGMGMAVEPDVKLQDGEPYEFDGWTLQAVWTPGHTPGHMCMYEPNRKLMLTGDHVLPHITPNVSLHEDQEGASPLADFRASLEKVAAFDTELALPAHEFNMRDLPARCRQLLHHHDDRLDEVREALGGGTASASAISALVHWNTGPYEGFSVHTKRAALGETLSHLVLLEEQGRVRRHDEGERVLWEQS